MNEQNVKWSAAEDTVVEIGTDNPRLIAFYLSQFHPVPENDLWWGKGFTEWTNVTKAAPLFSDHYQPHLPTDFGFYDLRVRVTRHDQIKLAKQYGIDGFCYHYYWFSGQRILNKPLDDMLADPESDMPFCLCWANENWTRRWDGAEHEILMSQRYLPEDDLNFIKDLMPFLSDPRYIRLDGVPLLIVYRPQQLPDARKTASIWREYCKKSGVGEIHLCAALTHGNQDYEQFGFNSGVEFPPHNLRAHSQTHWIQFDQEFSGEVFHYHTVAQDFLSRSYIERNIYRCVFPSWDNTARSQSRGSIILNGTPANYEYWLAESVRKTIEECPGQQRLVFINAWNEWAEGCHLEPDRKYQRGFLEATLRVKKGISACNDFADKTLPDFNPRTTRTFISDLGYVLHFHVWQFLIQLANHLKRYPKLRKQVRRLFGRFN